MTQITISMIDRSDREMKAILRDSLNNFSEKEHIEIELEFVPWDRAWSHLIEIALYQQGPDISEVGSTWLSDLVMMDSLRQFDEYEIRYILEDKTIFDQVNKSTQFRNLKGELAYYSIPWHSDVRVTYYRRDLLEKAGIDESSAFVTPEAVTRTLETLKQKGIRESLCLPTAWSQNTVHNFASWLWGRGKEFLSPDGEKVLLDDPEALSAIKDYFRLGHYMPPEYHFKNSQEIDRLFVEGKSAFLFSGYWVYKRVKKDIPDKVGITMMPGGIPFIGGINLIAWKHTPNIDAVLRLLKYLSNDETTRRLSQDIRFPISEDRWDPESPYQDIFKRSLLEGRSFPNSQLWGSLEKKLTEISARIWNDILTADKTVDEVVDAQITAFVQRLEKALGKSL